MDKRTSVAFWHGHHADPEALRAAAEREWEPTPSALRESLPSVEEMAQWGRDLHTLLAGAIDMLGSDPEQLTETVRQLRQTADGAEQEHVAVGGFRAVCEQLDAHASVFVEILSRLETADACLKLEVDHDD